MMISTLKLALSVMNGFDDCGMAPVFDISALPKNAKEKIKPMLLGRVEELENEFEQLQKVSTNYGLYIRNRTGL